MRNPRGAGARPKKWRGRWRAYVTLGWRLDGKPVRRWVYGATEGECLAKLEEAKRERDAGVVTDRTLTVRAYLHEWLERKADEVAPRTIEIYRAELAHILPILGRSRLADVKPLHIERALRSLPGKTVRWGRKQEATLTARAANRARSTLGAALADAVRLGLIATNPVDRTKPLRHREGEVVVWTAAEVDAFLTLTATGATQHALFYTALTTGMRIGELQALRRSDVDAAGIRVHRTAGSDGVKTAASRRIIPIADDTRQVLQAFWHALEAEGVESPLALPTTTGGMVSRQNVRKALHRWAGKAGVRPLRPHDLRHTFASMQIAAGATAAELAHLLGHTSPAFTLNRYVHLFERAEKRSARSLRDLTGAASEELEVVRRGGIRSDPN